jgi:predicted nuclease with TOPRIM domain
LSFKHNSLKKEYQKLKEKYRNLKIELSESKMSSQPDIRSRASRDSQLVSQLSDQIRGLKEENSTLKNLNMDL